MGLYDAIRDLPFRIADVQQEVHSQPISPEFIRKTTIIRLRTVANIRPEGGDGLGEDVTYDPNEHEPHRLPQLDLLGEWTIDSFSRFLAEQELFPAGQPEHEAYRDYRRWAYESAALDVALRQNDTNLGTLIGREAQPVRFVTSTRATDLDGWLALYPDLRFKLDPTPAWTDEVFATLSARGNVDVVDLKGVYQGTNVDNPPNPDLYRRVAEAFPDAWIEDPALTPETEEVLAPHRDRITWDAPIHSFADVEALPFKPRCLNSKPSRFGSLERLLTFYDRCAEEGIALYGGGQFELGPGRGHIQLLASYFHADSTNDVAPRGYNNGESTPGLETSPLDPNPLMFGFGRF
ncbi:MAG: hypothetical protein WCH31_00715 [Actinomycetes bacterium]